MTSSNHVIWQSLDRYAQDFESEVDLVMLRIQDQVHELTSSGARNVHIQFVDNGDCGPVQIRFCYQRLETNTERDLRLIRELNQQQRAQLLRNQQVADIIKQARALGLEVKPKEQE